MDKVLGHAGAGVPDLDDDVPRVARHRDIHPSERRAGRRVEGIVDQVAHQGDQIVVVQRALDKHCALRDVEFDAAFRGRCGLGQQKSAEHRIANPLQERLAEPLMHARDLADQPHGLIGSAQLYQPGNHVEAI
jgi:hypothetical protein